MPVRIRSRQPFSSMLKCQCKNCVRHSYRDGRCFADRKIKGIPISTYVYCEWATPPDALNKTTPGKSGRGGQNTVVGNTIGKKTQQR